MAFCNSCGAAVESGTKFCSKCGAAVSAPGTAPVATAPGAVAPGVPPKQGGSAVKIILIVVAVLVGLGIIGIGTVSYIGYRIAKSSHVTERNGKVSIDSPLGSMEANGDAEDAAREIGIDLYPGATPKKNGSVTMTIAGVHTTTAVLETSDSASKVAEFYRSKLPNANYTSQGDIYSMYSGGKDDMTTVTIQGQGDMTTIQLTRVSKAK